MKHLFIIALTLLPVTQLAVYLAGDTLEVVE